MTSSREAWERVLNAIEADTRRTEAMLRPPAEEFAALSPHASPDLEPALPADWVLPSWAELPALESMPPVPGELSERILTLRAKITALQTELATAMRDLPRPSSRRLIGAPPAAVASYVDRRL